MSDAPQKPKYSIGEKVIFQQNAANHVSDHKLDADGKTRHAGVITETPGFEGSFGGKTVTHKHKYEIQRKDGVYSIVREDAILGRVGEVEK